MERLAVALVFTMCFSAHMQLSGRCASVVLEMHYRRVSSSIVKVQ
jgi:hypothetical protein